MNTLEPRLSTLMRAALAGDAQAYRTLLGELSGALRRYFLARLGRDRLSDVEDLVQETLMAIHSRRATYDPGRPVTAWAHAIARYKLIDHLRAQKLRASVPLDGEEDALYGPDDVEPAMAKRDVKRMLDSLPAQPRRLITEVKLDGKSVAETALEAGLSESAVKVGIHRGLRALAARFGKRDDGDRNR